MQKVGELIQENFNFQLKRLETQDYDNSNYLITIIQKSDY